MEGSNFSVRYNVMDLGNIRAFAGIKGGRNGGCKDVYFVRGLGVPPDYGAEIEAMDRLLCERQKRNQGRYVRLNRLPVLVEPKDIAVYTERFCRWKDSGKRTLDLPSFAGNAVLQEAAGKALGKILEEYRRCSPNASESMEKNFMIKLLFWTEQTAGGMLCSWDGRRADKLVYGGAVKNQEYLFGYFMTLLGIDVLILLPQGELNAPPELLALSGRMEIGSPRQVEIPDYDPDRWTAAEAPAQNKAAEQTQGRKAVCVRRPDRDSRAAAQAGPGEEKRELGFEELALLASSVVMIAVHGKNGDVEATGSGIMISSGGYILTNNHVISGGHYYSIRIEGEEEAYPTDEIIKYHPLLDLAILRIDRRLQPLPIYRGDKPLVRGQKVVAIGSPLGLFNSVSDGIISGFRVINDVNMIQFTAPISHGSSGGAVLNMRGEIIGISTAGIDSGQNLNLAVDYTYIRDFVRGFTNA